MDGWDETVWSIKLPHTLNRLKRRTKKSLCGGRRSSYFGLWGYFAPLFGIFSIYVLPTKKQQKAIFCMRTEKKIQSFFLVVRLIVQSVRIAHARTDSPDLKLSDRNFSTRYLCEGRKARPTPMDLRSIPVEVHAFESHPSHFCFCR